MKHIIQKIEENGMEFLHLTSQVTDHEFYKGLCRLNVPGSLFRRIDIVVVPFDELGSSLLQWTGNDLFNRRLRYLAKTKGMKLNQHGLFEIEPDGSSRNIASKTEMDIFIALGKIFTEISHVKGNHGRIPNID